MAKNSQGHDDNVDGQLEALLSAAGPSIFAEAVRAEVDVVLAPGQALEPEARAKFVAAASRAVRERKVRTSSALETLLFHARREMSRAAAEVATAIHAETTIVRSIESGEEPITLASPHLLARWAATLQIDREALANGLQNTFARASGIRAYAGLVSADITAERAAFLDETLRAFDELDSHPGDTV